MDPHNRRVFVLHVIGGASSLAGGMRLASAADAPTDERVTEADPYARSMGFRLDTTQVDQAKYPRHDVTQKCSSCQLYDGKPGEALGPMTMLRDGALVALAIAITVAAFGGGAKITKSPAAVASADAGLTREAERA